MAVETSLNDIIEDAKGRTDREDDPALEGDVPLRWARQAVRKLWTLAAKLNLDQYTKTSASFTIASGNTHTIGTESVPVTDYMHLRGVELQLGDNWLPMRPYRFADRGNPGRLSYRLFGNVIDVQPTQLAGTYPLRFRYIYQPDLTAPGDPFELPDGGDDYCAEVVAAKIRIKYEESPDDHYAAQAMALVDVTRYLGVHDQGPPEQIPEAGDFPDDSGMGGWG